MPVPTTTSSQGSNTIVNTAKDVNPGASPFTNGEKVALGVAALGTVGLLWWASSKGVSLSPARDPRYKRRSRRSR